MKLFCGSSVVMRHWMAWPLSRTSSWLAFPVASASVLPSAIRICARTMSIPVTSSVTVCSTCTRGFTSMKKKSPESRSIRNSTVPAHS